MPARKPTELKVLQGTARPDREKNTPKPRPLVGNIPKGLPPEGKKLWREYAYKLEELGLASELDRPALERLCILHAKIKDLEQALDGAALITEGTHGTYKKDPRVTIYLQLLREYREYLKAFGMLPGPRQRMDVKIVDKELDEFERWLREKNSRD